MLLNDPRTNKPFLFNVLATNSIFPLDFGQKLLL